MLRENWRFFFSFKIFRIPREKLPSSHPSCILFLEMWLWHLYFSLIFICSRILHFKWFNWVRRTTSTYINLANFRKLYVFSLGFSSILRFTVAVNWFFFISKYSPKSFFQFSCYFLSNRLMSYLIVLRKIFLLYIS